MQTLQELLNIMQQLRDPQNGCPWDIEQTFASIAPYTIEEAYEVADAIERQQPDELCDELGDLLLQVVFHAQMAKEKGWFNFQNVADSIATKMVRRHPHVFGDTTATDAQTVAANWEQIKQQEKASSGKSPQSLLADVPNNLPGLTRAEKLTKKTATVGFDWPDISGVQAKVTEELEELSIEIAAGDRTRQEEEFGDVLFAMANLGRHLGLNAEQALRGANQRFIERFGYIEQHAEAPLESLDLKDLDALWNAAKVELTKPAKP